MNQPTLYGLLFMLYFGLALLTAIMARKTVIGFWGFLFLSLLITPLLPLLAIFLTRAPSRPNS
jgi:hypothetical protein